jgi:hypothetical protein
MSNERKMELRTKLRDIQKEYSAINAELKELDDASRKANQLEKYKDFYFKVGCHGRLQTPETITDLTDDHRLLGVDGQNTGLAYVDLGTQDGFCYVMLKSKEDYAYANTLLNRISAVDAIKNKDEKDKALHIKVLMGEATYE